MAGVITREKAAELSNAKKSDAADHVEMPSVTEQTYNFSKASMETKCGISMTTKKDINETAISSLDPDGLAAGCGLQEGDVMLSINGMRVTSHEQGAKLVQSVEGEVKVRVTRLVAVSLDQDSARSSSESSLRF